MTYNIHGWRDTFHEDNLERLIDAIAAAHADIVVLQEVLHPYAPPGDQERTQDNRVAYANPVNARIIGIDLSCMHASLMRVRGR